MDENPLNASVTTTAQVLPTAAAQPHKIGRMGRLAYLVWYGYFLLTMAGLIAVMFALALIQHTITTGFITGAISVISILAVMACFCLMAYSAVLAGIRRLHDVNRSGYWYFLALVPVIATVFALYLFFAPGVEQPNEYGSPLKGYRFFEVLGFKRPCR
jgi:uncharacterized membrane protein YhaH (DUF805 family)